MKPLMKQYGFSLVEVMVALIVGMILTAGLIQAFQSHRLSHQANEGFSILQENSRFALDMVGRYMRLAGYRDASSNSIEDDFSLIIGGTLMAPAPAVPGVLAGQVIQGVNGSSGAPDSVTFRYLGSILGASDNCLGTALTVGEVTNINFYISGSNLVCRSEVRDAATGAELTAVAEQVLAEGVDDMQVLYGLDDDANGAANRYANAAAITDWSEVVSVRLALLFNTTIAVESSDLTQNYTLLGTTSGSYTDRLRRRVVTTTVTLRN